MKKYIVKTIPKRRGPIYLVSTWLVEAKNKTLGDIKEWFERNRPEVEIIEISELRN